MQGTSTATWDSAPEIKFSNLQERLADLECTLKSGDIYNERILELPKRKVAISIIAPRDVCSNHRKRGLFVCRF